MIKILFICHGNICRSPMAEFILNNMIEGTYLQHLVTVDSAGTSTEELGNPLYPPARDILARHGISCKGKYARQVSRDEYAEYDYIIGMDSWNMRNMIRIFGSDPDAKIHLLMDYTDNPRDVSDPWYSRDFVTTYNDIVEGCEGLLKEISSKF